MQLISKFNKGFRFLLYIVNICSKYAWVIFLKDKKRINITNAFENILDKWNRKPHKIWVDKGIKFCNRSLKSFLQTNGIEMYSTHYKVKSVVAERCIRTLKYKIYKYMVWVSKSIYTDKLDDIVNKYNNAYHNTFEIEPVGVKSSTYIDSSKEIIDKDPKFKVGDTVRMSKYKNIFANGYTPYWSEEVFVIKKVKYTVPWTC